MATPLNPSKYLALAKALYRTGSPIDARSQYLDVSVTPNLFRDFANTQEVLDFLSNSNTTVQSLLRSGGFPVFVNTGGTLANGVITGGTRSEFWFKDGVADSNLVAKAATTGGYSLFFQNPQLQFQDYFHTAQAIKIIVLKSGVATYQYSLNGGSTWVTPTLPLSANIAISADTIVTHKITYSIGVVTALIYIELV